MTRRPSVIWAYDFDGGRARTIAGGADEALPQEGQFRWLHLNLADQRTRDWIEAADAIPLTLREMLLDSERHQRAVVEDGYVGCVLHDVERDFDRLDTDRTGLLRVALGPAMIITARQHPVRSADIIRRKLERGAPVEEAADALELAVSAIVEHVAKTATDMGQEIESFEDELLGAAERFDHRRLVNVRRRVVQFHRILSGMHGVFRRLEDDPDLPPDLLAVVEKLAQRLEAIDRDMVSIRGQLQTLREEADLQAQQRTNQNLYVLSILSALLLPATLVTGFFGMNTGGLPFASGGGGTAEAAVIAIGASLGVWALLRFLGLHRN